MRTLVDIPEEDLAKTKKITGEQGISRAEFVRRAVRKSLEPDTKQDIS
jgi:metal-responsive CopG/Arc/MetJ family transcriptional regulator